MELSVSYYMFTDLLLLSLRSVAVVTRAEEKVDELLNLSFLLSRSFPLLHLIISIPNIDLR